MVLDFKQQRLNCYAERGNVLSCLITCRVSCRVGRRVITAQVVLRDTIPVLHIRMINWLRILVFCPSYFPKGRRPCRWHRTCFFFSRRDLVLCRSLLIHFFFPRFWVTLSRVPLILSLQLLFLAVEVTGCSVLTCLSVDSWCSFVRFDTHHVISHVFSICKDWGMLLNVVVRVQCRRKWRHGLPCMAHLLCEVFRAAVITGGMLPFIVCCNACHASGFECAICLFWPNHPTKIAMIHSYDTSGSAPEYLATIGIEWVGGDVVWYALRSGHRTRFSSYSFWRTEGKCKRMCMSEKGYFEVCRRLVSFKMRPFS